MILNFFVNWETYILGRELNCCVLLKDLCLANLPDKMNSRVKVINHDILKICTSKSICPFITNIRSVQAKCTVTGWGHLVEKK